MDGTMLAGLEHDNFVGALSAVASNVEGSSVRRRDGVALIATGLPIALFNQVLIEGEDWSPEAIIEAVGSLRRRGGPFALNLRVGPDDAAIPVAADLGLRPLSSRPWMPGMALHPLPALTPAASHDIRLVTDLAGLDDHIRAAAIGFEMPEPMLRSIMAGSLDAGDDVTVYVAYVEGQPVGAGLGMRTGRTIGIYNIATVPSARRRGLGAAMTMRIVDDGLAAGCDVAVLQASDMGRPIYERLGFRTVVEYMGYTDRA
jgi:GNAT superfamily N-acetyltransferase